MKGMVLMINTTNIKDDLEFVSKDNTNQKFDNEFKTINAEVLSQIAEKWLKAMEENNVEAILPKTKEELSFFEVWWYNLSLVKKFCHDNPNADLSEDQLIFGYYNEPFYVGNWFWQQKDRLKDKKFNEYQKTALEAIKVKKAEERNIYTGLSTAQRWLLAIKNDTVSDLLPASKSELKFFNLWWYNFSLVYLYYQENEYPSFEPLTFVDGYYGEKFDIGSWLLKQKRQEANRKLFKEQIKALDGLDMVWSKKSSNYRTKKSDIVASKWLKAIRNNEIEKVLPSSLGRLKKYDIWWYNFALVKKYLETNNNLNLSDLKIVVGYYGENAHLGNWLSQQRNRRISNNLSNLQIEALNSIHMVWKKAPSSKEQWLLNYEEAKKYKDKYGNLLIPKDYTVIGLNGIELHVGVWVRNQRARYEARELTDEQVELLVKIGMVWRVSDLKWNEYFEMAKKYWERYGNLFVLPTSNINNAQALYSWLAKQREAYWEGKLSLKKAELLESLNISWLKLKIEWLKMYDYAYKYYIKNGNIRVTYGYSFNDIDGNPVNLGNWLQTQQYYYRDGNLKPLQIEMLNKIGIIWEKYNNKIANVKLFATYNLIKYVTREFLERYSLLEMNAKINFCKDSQGQYPLVINGKLNPIFTMSSQDIKENCNGISLEDMIIKYQDRLALIRS